MHTHMKSRSACENIIKNVIHKKIPNNVGNYYLSSLIRVSIDERYNDRVQQLIDFRKLGRKQYYFNPSKKNSK